MALRTNPDPDDARRPSRTGPFPGEHRHGEHAQRQRRQGEAGEHGVVLEGDLEEDRQRDHQPAQGDLLHHLLGHTEAEVGKPEQVGVEQGRLAALLAPDQPPRQTSEGGGADQHDAENGLRALLPGEDAEDDPPHSDHRQQGADQVDLSRPGVGDVPHSADLGEHYGDDDDLEPETDPPREVGGHRATEQRSHRRRDRCRRPHQCVSPTLGGAFEVAVDERLHRRQQQRCAEPADDGPEDHDGDQALGDRHRQRPDCVGEQAEHVGPLPPDEIAHLAADQDEGRRDQGFEGDRRLDTAHRRVQVGDHRRYRHVHQRGVDDEDEHGRGEEHRQTLVTRLAGPLGDGAGVLVHLVSRHRISRFAGAGTVAVHGDGPLIPVNVHDASRDWSLMGRTRRPSSFRWRPRRRARRARRP